MNRSHSAEGEEPASTDVVPASELLPELHSEDQNFQDLLNYILNADDSGDFNSLGLSIEPSASEDQRTAVTAPEPPRNVGVVRPRNTLWRRQVAIARQTTYFIHYAPPPPYYITLPPPPYITSSLVHFPSTDFRPEPKPFCLMRPVILKEQSNNPSYPMPRRGLITSIFHIPLPFRFLEVGKFLSFKAEAPIFLPAETGTMVRCNNCSYRGSGPHVTFSIHPHTLTVESIYYNSDPIPFDPFRNPEMLPRLDSWNRIGIRSLTQLPREARNRSNGFVCLDTFIFPVFSDNKCEICDVKRAYVYIFENSMFGILREIPFN